MTLNENVFVSLMVLVISLMLNKVIFKLSFTLSVMFSLISSRLLKAEKLIGTGKLWTIPQKYLLNASAMYVSMNVFQSPINLKKQRLYSNQNFVLLQTSLIPNWYKRLIFKA